MSSRISLRKVLVLGASMLVALLQFAAAPASANAAAALNCVAEAPLAGDNTPPSPTCFASFGDAIAFATGNKIHLQNATKSRAVTEDEMTGATAGTASPFTTFVLSIDYKDASFGGATFTWTASSGCGSFSAASMPSGWNDVVSSVAAFSGCAVSLYQNGSFGGTKYAIGVNGSSGNLGSFNDQDSSEKWCPTYPCS